MFSHIKELFTRPSGYTIARSVRLRSSASAYLNRTPASSTSSSKYTLSMWVKMGALQDEMLFAAGASTANQTYIRVYGGANQAILWETDTSSTSNWYVQTSALFRDPSAWYHFVFAYDSSLSGVTNQAKIYVNGVQASVSTGGTGTNSYVNTTVAHYIGRHAASSLYFDGYLTEINFIDGQALTPSSFGETDSITGVWKAKKYSGTYGTNGFYLNFSDNSSNTATTIGKDYSGNGNNWTPNNISVTAGATYDSMVDSPTVSAVSSNYPVWNPLVPTGQAAPTDGNLSQINSTGCRTATIPFPQSGKWYLEWLAGSNTMAIVVGLPFVPTTQANSQTYSVGYYNNGNKYIAGTATSYGATFTSGDIIGLALDFTVSPPTITFYKNNSSQGAINLTSGIDYVVAAGIGGTGLEVINFGQRPFSYSPPTGFVALNTYNLPASTIKNGAGYMASTTYTGDSASPKSFSNAVNGVSFQPDFVWIKNRSNAYFHNLYDSVRGTGSTKNLISNGTYTEGDSGYAALYGYLSAFNSNGFQTTNGTDGAGPSIWANQSGQTYVAWQWKAGGSSSSNTNGSITSTVSVGATQGFSVVTYTASSSASTIGHGLGVAPSMIIQKNRDAVSDWGVYHISVGATKYLRLNTTDVATTNSVPWNDTTPTSTVFSIGTGYTNGNKYVAYCFAAVAGYSAFGSFTGNSTTDNAFIYTGFRPRFVLIKRTDGVSNWYLLDSSRSPYNLANALLRPNLSDAEVTATNMDLVSNGIKLRDAGFGTGETYIYAAFAENPFKNALAR